MYIRRNMSTNVSFHEIKEYHLFKQLAKVNDSMILKEVLPLVVKKVTLDLDKQFHTKNNFIYMPQEQYQTTQQGSNMEQLKSKKSKLNSKMKFFIIQSKIYKILKFVFYKKIDCMENMKNLQKLNFFYRSNLDQIPFGSYLYRKNDQITHIYYLVRGQIQISKSIDQKQIKITTLHEGTFFGIYEIDKNKTKRILNASSSSNDTIVISVNLDLLTQLFGKTQNEVIQKLLTLNSQCLKIKNQEDKKFPFENYKIKKTNFIKAYDFQRRLIKFSDQHKNAKKDPVFAKYIQNKSLLYKIKDSNNTFPKEQKENSNIFVNFHKNQSTTKYCNRLNKHRMTTMGPFFQNSQQNLHKVRKQRLSRQVDILSSRLKKRFDESKRNFSMTGFDMIVK